MMKEFQHNIIKLPKPFATIIHHHSFYVSNSLIASKLDTIIKVRDYKDGVFVVWDFIKKNE